MGSMQGMTGEEKLMHILKFLFFCFVFVFIMIPIQIIWFIVWAIGTKFLKKEWNIWAPIDKYGRFTKDWMDRKF